MPADSASEAGKPGPYAGLRVVDLTTVVLGPYTGQLLGDLGADVIKIEGPEGDSARMTGATANGTMASHWLNLNRNKRSLSLDLKQPAAKEAMHRLLATADVFVHNMRNEPLARLGFSYAQIAEKYPRLIFCGIVGFGSKGRYAGRPAFDDVIQGASGIAALQGKETGQAKYVAQLIADKTTALFAVHAIGASLYWREKTGRGQELEIPMFESMTSFTMIEHLWGRSFEPAQGRTGSPRHAIPLRRPYKTQDSYICLLPGQDRHWDALFKAAGEPEHMQDPRFTTKAKRTANTIELYKIVERLLMTRPTAEWVETLAKAGVPCMAISDPEDVVDDPHLADVGFFPMIDHPTEGRVRQIGIPISFSETPGSIRRHPPLLGEHGREVLGELGFGEAEIDAMAASGATKLAG